MKLRTYSAHHIDVEVGKDGMDPWRFTGIYGFAGRDVRNRTWDLVEALGLQQCNLAWLMTGEFNEIMSNADKFGGTPRALAAITKLWSTMTRCGLMDMGFVGNRFTWSNKFTKERLDRGFQSPLWRSRFPYSRAITLNPSDSDHNPILVEVRSDCRLLNTFCKRFRFEEGWSGRAEAESIIKQAWAQPTTRNMLGQIAYKIRTAGSKLMEWHKTDFNKQRKEARIIEEKLNDLMRQPYSPHQYEEKKLLHIQLSKILAAQEKYWRQRSCIITWLKDGDRNSEFFHRRACNRKTKNTIKSIIDESGNWTTNPEDIERIIIQYFSTIYSTEQVNATALQEILNVTPSKVTLEMNAMLLMPYTGEEIRQAVFQMHPSKSPGPDGMTPFFFQRYWKTVFNDFCHAV